MFARTGVRADGLTAEMPPLLDIVDQKINHLTHNAKDLCGI